MNTKRAGRVALWACGASAIVAAFSLVVGLGNDSLVLVYVSVAASVLVVPLLVAALTAFALSSSRSSSVPTRRVDEE